MTMRREYFLTHFINLNLIKKRKHGIFSKNKIVHSDTLIYTTFYNLLLFLVSKAVFKNAYASLTYSENIILSLCVVE